MFIITFIVGWVASIQPVKVPSSTFFRDIVFQAAATLLLALNFWLGFVNIWISLLYLLFYFVYVYIVLYVWNERTGNASSTSAEMSGNLHQTTDFDHLSISNIHTATTNYENNMPGVALWFTSTDAKEVETGALGTQLLLGERFLQDTSHGMGMGMRLQFNDEEEDEYDYEDYDIGDYNGEDDNYNYIYDDDRYRYDSHLPKATAKINGKKKDLLQNKIAGVEATNLDGKYIPHWQDSEDIYGLLDDDDGVNPDIFQFDQNKSDQEDGTLEEQIDFHPLSSTNSTTTSSTK